ncbi:hypothetical protein [Fusobacterium ulcerans]|uniref:Uncharacterized protein n=1 Tax=Fusobacterium ulcerans 12-1B TaxID=457404 RepID=H1PTV4_9FUSO|nr:hypothetical protein [Fusobacterium ulcerans]EHO80774.1 hypothetical protein HMPREF0402_01847 [Fusobacterium ulcerans 12-1B]
MPRVTKHIYESEIKEIIKILNTQLKSIQDLLPKNYIENLDFTYKKLALLENSKVVENNIHEEISELI